MENKDYFDNFLDYSIVIESMTEPNKDFKIIQDGKTADGLDFLRFETCLQTFGNRNRNRRLWFSKWMRMMLQATEVQELLQNGGIPGEAGHPIPPVGKVTIERVLTIDPNNISHLIRSFKWVSDNQLNGIIETIDDGNGPGNKFKRNIMQGLPTSFSTRSLIPQRKNPDGSIDQTGPGRYVTSDRVFVPSHQEAYINKSIPVKEICKKTEFEYCMESFASFVLNKSEKINRIIDNMDPAMESATIDNNGIVSVPTKEGIVFVRPELKYRNELASFMKDF